jgi:hypothetical protein
MVSIYLGASAGWKAVTSGIPQSQARYLIDFLLASSYVRSRLKRVVEGDVKMKGVASEGNPVSERHSKQSIAQ